MTHRTLVLAIFHSEAAADDAAASLRLSGAADGDVIGVLALDSDGRLNEQKVGSRGTSKAAGIGSALFLLGPGAVGSTTGSALHHKGLKLDSSERARITAEIRSGKAAVGVLAKGQDVAIIAARLADLGGVPESHGVAEEELNASAAE